MTDKLKPRGIGKIRSVSLVSFEVMCGICSRTGKSTGLRKLEFKRYLLQTKWSLTDDHGWICFQCTWDIERGFKPTNVGEFDD